jgi:ribonuclease HI
VQQPFHYQEEVILKVDGSFLRERLSAGCGGFLSSASEKWICGFTQKLLWNPNLTDNETEREAILRGLLWVKGKGKKKVVVKTDNKGNADLVNSGGRSTDPVICGIRDLLKSKQWEASLSWISRGENDVADKLAQKAKLIASFLMICKSLIVHLKTASLIKYIIKELLLLPPMKLLLLPCSCSSSFN